MNNTSAITFGDLSALWPLLLATATAVVLMLLIAIKRNHTLTCAVTITGFSLAGLSALLLMGGEDSQSVTALLIIDKPGLFFTLLACATTVVISVFSYPYFLHLQDKAEEFYLLISIATIGALVVLGSQHFVSAFLGLEILSISLYGMIAYPLHCRNAAKFPIESSMKYLVLSAVASVFILFGIALIFSQTGSLQFTDLSSLSSSDDTASAINTSIIIVATILFSSGIAFKLSLAPFHVWTPDVYEGAPLPAATFLASTGKVVMFFLLLRFFTSAHVFELNSAVTVFTVIAAISVLAGNLLALLQDNAKRLLAYSSIAHMGYLLIALIATGFGESGLGIEAVSFYLLAYLIMTLGAFGVLTVISDSEKELDYLGDYQGLFWKEPWLALVFTAMLLSLAGIPLTIGFIGKFYIFLAAVESGLWFLLAILVIGSAIGIYYYLRIIYRMIMPDDFKVTIPEAGLASSGAYVLLAVLLLLLLFLGIYPAAIMSLIESFALAA